jgi:chemotaxis protein MotA
LAVDGTDPDLISDTLSLEMDEMSSRHEAGRAIFDLMAKYAPAFGMIGTLVGLILMLAELDDPAKIAPNMAVAPITTFYGALMANMFCMPVADKLGLKQACGER